MKKSQDEMQNRITSFQIGPDPDKDSVPTENLLMKLSLAESIFNDMANYIDSVEANAGTRPDNTEAPDTWAIIGARSNITDVSHALKCGCFGHKTAFMR